jgi:perosamine synthetase
MIDQIHPVYGEEETNAVTNYMCSGAWLTEFKKTRELEDMIASFTGAKYCCVVANGTIALQIAVMTVPSTRDSRWACPDYTMAASMYAIELSRKHAMFVDIDRETYNIDSDKLQTLVNKGYIEGIMHVSINGRSNPISEIVKQYKGRIPIIEDSCQSMSSRLNGKHLGTFGDIGVLSLNAFKLVSSGQGGVLLTDNKDYYDKMVKLKDFGRSGGRGSQYEILGMNAKYTDLQAVIAIEQMKKIRCRIDKKKLLWKWYTECLKDIRQVYFIETNLNDCTPWFIDPLVEKRDELIEYLRYHNIESQPFYPALHNLPYCNGSQWGFPNADYVSKHGIWLPSSVDLERPTVDYICGKIKEFYKS